jgi:hydroxylaminobenzene mutase
MKNADFKKKQAGQLIFWGVVLFFLGLIAGILVPFFANPRMGASSHIQGTFNGLFLIVWGLIWHKIELSKRWLRITFWLAVYGTFANWLGVLLAAIFNGGKLLGVMAEGQAGPPWIEPIISFLLISLGLAMLISCGATLIGLKKGLKLF